jgi:hypothetical protein
VAGRFSLGSSRRLTLQWGVHAAARVSFTVETTVLPSFALPRGTCKWEGFVLVLCVFQPRIDRIFANGEQLRWRFCLLVLFVFIRGIRGSRTYGQDGRKAWFGYRWGGGRSYGNVSQIGARRNPPARRLPARRGVALGEEELSERRV